MEQSIGLRIQQLGSGLAMSNLRIELFGHSEKKPSDVVGEA